MIFCQVALGLVLSPTRTTVNKPLSEKGLRASTSGGGEGCRTLSSTHAFGARCCSQAVKGSEDANTTSCHSDSSGSWRQRFVLHSASVSNPSILVGAASVVSSVEGESQSSFDQRVLGTPMLWEEPHAYFLECRRNGGFLWSESAQTFGKKVFDQCFADALDDAVVDVEYVAPKLSSASFPASAGKVVFRIGDEMASLDVLVDDASSSSAGGGGAGWSHQLAPHVTLIDAGDSASIVH